jgi:NAD(P)-dependent dehydrogenase (short-subunit alcohol dehydrogenase family)
MKAMFATDALAGKRILVTGGGSGLGREVALAFARHGAAVYICGRREGVLQETADACDSSYNGSVAWRIADIRDAQSIDDMVADIWTEGPLTGLINNAAANFVSPTKDISARGYEAIRSTVMDGSFFSAQAVGRRWIEQGLPGSIVSTLVTWVWTGSPFTVPSTMAKTAIHAMTKSLAVEWAKYNIRLNAVAPGPFPTKGAWEKLDPSGESTGATSDRYVPMGRYGDPQELGNLLIFLQADGCDYLTGQTIAIDGGHHLAAPSTFADMLDLDDAEWAAKREKIKAASAQEKSDRSVG